MYEARNVKPMNGWAILLAEKRQAVLNSGIILATETGEEKVTELSGQVIRIGDGTLCEFMRKQGLKEGCRVVYRGFLKYANPLPTVEKWEDGEEKRFFLINCNDILGIAADDLVVGVFSGSRAAPHIQPSTSKIKDPQ